MIPHYRIARADALLRRYPPYRETVEVCHGYFLPRFGTPGPTVLDVLTRGLDAGQEADAEAPAPRQARAA